MELTLFIFSFGDSPGFLEEIVFDLKRMCHKKQKKLKKKGNK